MKLLFLATILISGTVQANSCAKDAQKFCQGVDPGKGQLARCLSDYQNQLSPNCARELKDFKNKTGKKNPCFEDLAEFCADIPADPHKIEYCLLKNEHRLSPTCSMDFKKKKGNILVRDVCAQDIANTCYSEVSEVEGSITKCLIKNKAKLSRFCQNSVDKRIVEMRKRNPCFDDTQKYCPTQVRVADIQDCLEKNLSSIGQSCKQVVQLEMKKASANPCYKDLVRHCRPGISPSQQHECLTLNEKELSRSCQTFRTQESLKIKKMVDLCEKDRLKVCSTAPFQDGMVVKCLRQNKLKISKQCADLL